MNLEINNPIGLIELFKKKRGRLFLKAETTLCQKIEIFRPIIGEGDE